MPTRIDTMDAAELLDELVSRVPAGEDIILTIEGRDIARLVPHAPQPGIELAHDKPARDQSPHG